MKASYTLIPHSQGKIVNQFQVRENQKLINNVYKTQNTYKIISQLLMEKKYGIDREKKRTHITWQQHITW